MKINSILTNRMFKTGSVLSASTESLVASGKNNLAPTKTDTISISRAGSSQRVFSGIVRDIMREMETQDSSVRVEELRTAVNEGSYAVPSGAVADAILNRVYL